MTKITTITTVFVMALILISTLAGCGGGIHFWIL